jgi:hypothetical protein
MSEKKSLLDGMEIKEDPSYQKVFRKLDSIKEGEEQSEPLSIVNHCPKCGSPIYGTKYVAAGKEPVVKRTCSCFPG